MPKDMKTKKGTKNVAFYVVRNKTKQEVLKVIFPNGAEIGGPHSAFRRGFKVWGDTTVNGTLYTKDVVVDGTSIGSISTPSIAITPSIIPVETTVTGGRGAATTSTSGVGSTAGQGTDTYQHDLSAISFVKVDCLAGITDVTYNGYAGSATTPSANNTYLLQGGQVTATTDAGTTVSVSSSTSTEETDTFGLTGSIGSYPIFNLQVSKDSSDAKLKLTFLSEHATSTTDYDSVLVGVPFTIKTASGTSNDVLRYFTIQKQKGALDGADGDDAPASNNFVIDVVPPTITIPIPIPSGTEFHTPLQNYQSIITDFAKVSGRYGPSNLKFSNNHSGVPGTNDLWAFNTHGKSDFVSASMVTSQGSAPSVVGSNQNTLVYTGTPDVHFFQIGMNLDGNDAKFEFTPSGSAGGTAARPFPAIDVAPIRHIDFRFPCVAQISGSLLVATGSCRVTYQYADAVSPVNITTSPSVISVVTSVTGGTPNGVAAATVAGVGAINGQTTDIYQNDISSTAFIKADAFEGISAVLYDGFGTHTPSYASPDPGKFYIQGHQITASTDTGLVVSASAVSHPANGTNDFGITGSIGTTPIFNLQVEDDGNDAKLSVTFLAEHASSADYDSIKIDIPFAATNAAGITLHNKIRSFNIQKAKNPADPTDGADAGGAIIQVKNNAAMNNIDGGSTTYSASSFNITDLVDEIVNVGSDMSQSDVVKTADNTIDDGTGTNDSIRTSASTTYKFDITVVLTFGTSHADLVFDRGVTQARIGGNCYLVHATNVDQASHGSTSRTYGDEAENPQPWQVTYESASALPTSGAGITMSWSEVVTTSSSVTFFWLRVDYAAITNFHDSGDSDVALPQISVFSASMTATKIS